MTIVDRDDLTIVATQDFSFSGGPAPFPVHDSEDGVVYQLDVDGTLQRNYIGEPERPKDRWSLPSDAPLAPLAALPGGVLIAVESGQFTRGSYLVVMNVDGLLSGFGDYHTVVPERLLDTRYAIGVPTAKPIGTGKQISVDLAGRGGLPDTGVLAVTMNATVTEPIGSGFIKIWPSDRPFPEVSNVNYVRGQSVANSVTVTVGDDGEVLVFASTAAHVLLDITGYYTDSSGPRGARYRPLAAPSRVLDTRNSVQGRFGRIGAGRFLDIDVPAPNGGGAKAVAAVVNVTITNASAPSHLSVTPLGIIDPGVSTINFVPGDLRSNLAIVPTPTSNRIRVYNNSGSVDVIVDVLGHYVEAPPGAEWVDQVGRYYPVTPFRRFDSRESSPFPGNGALEPGTALILGNSTGWTDIWNVTVDQPTQDGYLTVRGYLQGELATSSVNFVRGETVANAAYVTGGPDNVIINPLGFTHVVVDVAGYLTPPLLTPINQVFDASLTAGVPDGLGVERVDDSRRRLDCELCGWPG